MSDSAPPLDVVLCWHMHQPDYRGPDHSDFQLPWVYLHGIKDYVDMVGHLEAIPDARAVVNFAPVLLEQIDDYVLQIDGWLERGERIKDPLLWSLAGPGLPVDQESRLGLIRDCLRANEHNLIGRFPVFQELAQTARGIEARPETLIYYSDQYIVDLLVWYHLAWMGEFPRQASPLVRSLEKKERNFNSDDRRRLVALIGDLLRDLLARYSALAEAGRIELAVSPYAHPITPLLQDIGCAREAMPEAPMPAVAEYPGGDARARWHVRRGVEVFERHFGRRPHGCWPSEGAISGPTLRVLAEEGFRWAASGEQVLQNSLNAGGDLSEGWLHTPYRLHENNLNCFFRDDGLSDLIGFSFSDWHADDAVQNLIEHLERIRHTNAERPNRIVSIIMDGENAWEYYPRNGWYFLGTLYRRLSEHPHLRLTTFSEFLDRQPEPSGTLSRIVAGSWVYGTLSTWIGDPDKNRAWEMLAEAKRTYDRVLSAGELDPERQREAELQLATCEGSDWFWWFGDYNPGPVVAEFEKLFRRQLTQLYSLLGQSPPTYLGEVFARGEGAPDKGGVMRKN